MNIYTLKDLSMAERLSVLEGDNAGVEDGTYVKPLTDTETSIEQSEMVATMIQRSLLEAEFDTVKKDYKDRIEPLKESIAAALDNLKTRTKEVKGRLYKMIDYDNKAVHFVDPEGNVVNSRMMKPEERQLHISRNYPPKQESL